MSRGFRGGVQRSMTRTRHSSAYDAGFDRIGDEDERCIEPELFLKMPSGVGSLIASRPATP
jgi:hypothetical protein